MKPFLDRTFTFRLTGKRGICMVTKCDCSVAPDWSVYDESVVVWTWDVALVPVVLTEKRAGGAFDIQERVVAESAFWTFSS